MKRKVKSSKGFSLLEVVVAVLIFGLFLVAFGAGVSNSIQANANAERRMRAELNVSNAANYFLAEGYDTNTNYGNMFPDVSITAISDTFGGGYKLTIAPRVTDAWTQSVSVSTYVRAS